MTHDAGRAQVSRAESESAESRCRSRAPAAVAPSPVFHTISWGFKLPAGPRAPSAGAKLPTPPARVTGADPCRAGRHGPREPTRRPPRLAGPRTSETRSTRGPWCWRGRNAAAVSETRTGRCRMRFSGAPQPCQCSLGPPPRRGLHPQAPLSTRVRPGLRPAGPAQSPGCEP